MSSTATFTFTFVSFLGSITDDDEREKANQDLKEIFRLQVKQQDLALKDIADAILLANSFEVEKQARFERLKILSTKVLRPYRWWFKDKFA